MSIGSIDAHMKISLDFVRRKSPFGGWSKEDFRPTCSPIYSTVLVIVSARAYIGDMVAALRGGLVCYCQPPRRAATVLAHSRRKNATATCIKQ